MMAAMQFTMPAIDGSAPVQEQVRQLKSLVGSLSEQLRYAFANLNEDNMTPAVTARIAKAETAAKSVENVLLRLDHLAEKRSLAALMDTVDGKVSIYYQQQEPVSPAAGDIWYDTDASPVKVFRFNGTLWEDITTNALSAALAAADAAKQAADTKVRTFAQAAAPTGMAPGDAGDLWLDTDDHNKLYRYSGSAWEAVQDSHYDSAVTSLQALASKKTTVHYSPSAPADPLEGDVWYDTDIQPVVINRWSGSAWEDITSAALSRALDKANDAQATADGKVRTFAQATAPTGMAAGDVGDLWLDTANSNRLSRWDGMGWADVQDNHSDELIQDLDALTRLKTTVYYEPSEPLEALAGDIWYDMDAKPVVISRREAGGWADITAGVLGEALETAKGAKSTAERKITTFAQPTEPSENMHEGDLWFDTAHANKPYRYTREGEGYLWKEYGDTHLDDIVASTGEYCAKLSRYVFLLDDGLKIKKPTSGQEGEAEYSLRIKGDRVSFLEGEGEIAWLTNKTLFISKVEIADMLTIGTNAKHFFDWENAVGHLTLKYRAGVN